MRGRHLLALGWISAALLLGAPGSASAHGWRHGHHHGHHHHGHYHHWHHRPYLAAPPIVIGGYYPARYYYAPPVWYDYGYYGPYYGNSFYYSIGW